MNIKLALLKAKLKREYKKYKSMKGDLDCGTALVTYINPDIEKQWKKCMTILAQCKELENKIT